MPAHRVYLVNYRGYGGSSGAPTEDAGGTDAGAAYIFQRDGSSANDWVQVKKLIADGVTPNMGKIFANGNFVQMQVVYPEISAVSWPSFMTGKDPDDADSVAAPVDDYAAGLAADALQPLAFQVLAEAPEPPGGAAAQLEVTVENGVTAFVVFAPDSVLETSPSR